MKSVSPSQISDFLRCPRLWWATRVLKLPTIDKGYGIFGTVLHGCVERWLLADDTGRDHKTGKPVDIYPPHWWVARNKFTGEPEGEINRVERAHVQVLIETAIEQGDLRRWPGRKLEVPMRRPVVPGVLTHSYIDVLLPHGIVDHKTTKNMSYAKSKNALREDIQLLFYAAEVMFRSPEIEEITGAHIYYSKDPDDSVLVKTVPVVWHVSEVAEAWAEIIEITKSMQRIEELGQHEPWFDVPGPVSFAQACNAFGGCDFRPVCGRRESVTRYKARVERVVAHRSQPTSSRDERSRKERRSTMPKSNLFDEVMGGGGDKPTATKKAKAAKATKEPADEKPTKKGKAGKGAKPETLANGKAEVYEPAPWADESCPACSGVGFSSKGAPCRVCVGRSAKSDGPTPDDYEIELDEHGVITWTEIEGGGDDDEGEHEEEGDRRADNEPEEPEGDDDEGEDDVLSRAKKSRATKKSRAVKEDAAEDKPTKKSTEKFTDGTSGGGRGKNPPTLYVDCIPQGISAEDISTVFEPLAADLAKAQKVESYYELDTWKRREAFRQVASKAAEVCAGKHLVCCTRDPDQHALVDALAPHSIVVRGVR